MSNPYDTQVGGNHYQKMKIQPSEFINKNQLQFAEAMQLSIFVARQ